MNSQDSKNMAKNKGKIGVFDSGFGGLDIFRHISDRLSEYDFVYLGDTARTPYGTRSKETVYEYTCEGVDFLFEKNCDLILLACNTASADALPKIQQEYLIEKFPNQNISGKSRSKNVLGVIIPATEEAERKTKNNKVGVIATESSVKSGAFIRELHKNNKNIQVFQQACPLLAPIVEADETSDEILLPVLEKYLKPLVESEIDTLILGCTHYGILRDQIENVLAKFGSDAQVINEGDVVADKLADYLKRHQEIDQNLSKNSNREFYTTDLTDKFSEIGSKIVGSKIDAKKVVLKMC